MKISHILAAALVAVSCSTNDSPGKDFFEGDGDLSGGGDIGDALADSLLGDGSAEAGELEVAADVESDVPVSPGGFELYPLAPSVVLRGVWGDGQTVLAVGDKGTILRHQGSHWSPMPAPTAKDLYAVFGLSADDVYAAGQDGMIVYFDGEEWTKQETGLGSMSGITLRGVWGAEGHVYVVGDDGTVLHRFESQWKEEDSLSTYDLYAIWGSSLLDIWVAAQGGSVLRKIGGAWSSQQVTKGETLLFALQGVSSNHIWGAGSKGGIVVRKESGWTQMISNDAYDRSLRGAWVLSQDDVWFIGDEGALIHSMKSGNDLKWLTADIAGPYYKNFSFFGLWGKSEPSEAWAVGEKGAVLHYDGTGWKDEASGPEVDLHDIAGSAWSDAVAVGGDGLVLAFDGSDWRGLDRVTDAELKSVTGFGEGFLAVGSAGALVKISGGSLEASAVDGVEVDLNGVCTSGSEVYSVGNKGKIVASKDGATWTPVSNTLQDALRDCVAGDNEVIAVGDMGRILLVSDGKATKAPFATQFNLQRAAAGPDGTIWIVGDNGVVLKKKKTAGAEFEKVYEEPGLFLHGVHAFDGLVVAVGWGGRILLLDPSSGEVESHKVEDAGVLHQIWGADKGHMFVVGRKGRMLRYVAE